MEVEYLAAIIAFAEDLASGGMAAQIAVRIRQNTGHGKLRDSASCKVRTGTGIECELLQGKNRGRTF